MSIPTSVRFLSLCHRWTSFFSWTFYGSWSPSWKRPTMLRPPPTWRQWELHSFSFLCLEPSSSFSPGDQKNAATAPSMTLFSTFFAISRYRHHYTPNMRFKTQFQTYCAKSWTGFCELDHIKHSKLNDTLAWSLLWCHCDELCHFAGTRSCNHSVLLQCWGTVKLKCFKNKQWESHS